METQTPTRENMYNLLIKISRMRKNWQQWNFIDTAITSATEYRTPGILQRNKENFRSYCGTTCCIAGHVTNTFGIPKATRKFYNTSFVWCSDVPVIAATRMLEANPEIPLGELNDLFLPSTTRKTIVDFAEKYFK